MKSAIDAEQEAAGTRGLDFVVGLVVLSGSLVGSILALQFFLLP